MRNPVRLVFASFLFAAVAAPGALAAPQVLGLVASAEPLPLVCEGGVCSAEFSTLCLQPKRPAPVPGTAYRPAGSGGLTLVVTAADGSDRRLAADALVNVRAGRIFSVVTISVPEAAVRALGPGNAALVVGAQASLVPDAIPGDDAPLSPGEIADATGPLRAVAAEVLARDDDVAVAARLINRLVNALPRQGRASAERRASLWRHAAVAGPAAGPGVERAKAAYGLCRGMAVDGRVDSMRSCLEWRHDAFMQHVNERYFRAIETGS